MQRLLKKISRFVQAQDGPTAVEYAVMLALVLLVCFVAIRTIGTQLSSSFTNSANSIAS